MKGIKYLLFGIVSFLSKIKIAYAGWVCVFLCACVSIHFWMPEPIFMKPPFQIKTRNIHGSIGFV
jgi:hypothetical protein